MTSNEEDDDFDIVPQEPDDLSMWDIEDDNEDEAKQAIVKSKMGILCA